jgi:hypothetical protein
MFMPVVEGGVFIFQGLAVAPAAVGVVEQALFLVPLETPERQTLEAVLVVREALLLRQEQMEALAL